jgi:hypothetical protein
LSKSAKRKATSESPLRDTAPPPTGAKRKSPEDTPTPTASGDSPATAAAPKKKKKSRASSGSATPVPEERFPGMIESDDVLSWLRSQLNPMSIPQASAVQAFTSKIKGTPGGMPMILRNQNVFLRWIKQFTEKAEKNLRIKAEYMS